MKKLNLVNKKFGRLIAIKSIKFKNKLSWECQCDCGNMVIVPTFQLTSGNKNSCGCINVEMRNSIINKKFGRLTVISYSHSDRGRRSIYNCICECGKSRIAARNKLIDGTSLSCGCLTKEKRSIIKRKEYGSSTKNSLYLRYKNSAKQRNIKFLLSKVDVFKLFEGNCHYCGGLPATIVKIPNHFGSFTYNGIDRVDSNSGYIKENVVSCCQTCNYMKNTQTCEQFLNNIKKIAIHNNII